ncbi:MAG: hypothetical protein JO061_11615 [Acidobacteriaceae bacterium]|nr:hypothetical protein [Acidobacteriaceae bacterium]
MIKMLALSRSAATAAVFVLGLAATGTANAQVLKNGWFSQNVGLNKQICGQPLVGPSAATDWTESIVVTDKEFGTNSYFCTDVEKIGFFTDAIRVQTNGGDSQQWSQGNGLWQSWGRSLPCITASFWVKVVSGEVTGNLVLATGPFVEVPVFQPIQPAPAWKYYHQVASNVSALAFETLHPAGIIPPVNYLGTGALAQSCLIFPPIIDLSQYLSYDPFYSLENPGGPVEKIRITNTSSVTVSGPIHVLLEGIAPPLSVVNPDGDYLGTPFMDLSGSLAPGQSEDVTVQFASSSGAIPTFRVKLAAGDF